MLNIYCVWVKPGYSLKHVENLLDQCTKYIKYDFTFFCLTDQQIKSSKPITFVNVESFGLDTWWNKVLIFDTNISGNGVNFYLDLDTKILGDIGCLIECIDQDYLYVVDTIWKDQKYFDQRYKFPEWNKRADSFFTYGNSSIMGWRADSHSYLTKLLLDDVFKHTIEHYGDDTFINKYGNIKYFPPVISRQYGEIQIKDPLIWIHYKTNDL